jgi:integrase
MHESGSFIAMSDQRQRILFERIFTEDELRRLLETPPPETMDTRWHAVLKDGWLCVIRSWTSRIAFKLKISTGLSHHVIEAWAFEDEDQHRTYRDDQMIKNLARAVDAILREAK